MAKRKLPHPLVVREVEDAPQFDAEGLPLCPECGDPLLSEEDQFVQRIETIQDILEDAQPYEQMLTLAICAGQFVGRFDRAQARRRARIDLLKVMDENISKEVKMWAQYKREAKIVAPTHMPDVPSSVN